MAMKLLDVYKSMMQTAGLFVTEDHLVSCRLTEESTVPVMLKGKRLALPSQAILARPDKSDIVVFHPLMEQVHRGESEVLEKYRKLLMLRFNEVAGTVMLKLLSISTSVAEHASLTPDQAEFLQKVKIDDSKPDKPGEKPKIISTFEKVIQAMPADQSAKRIVTLFLKKTGSVAGKRYKRVGVVSFPLYEELKKQENDIYGVKCRVKDKQALLALMEYIFPNIEEVGSYNRGSDSDVASNLDALMQSSLALVQALNSVTETFEDVFNKNEDASSLFIDCDWQEAFVNLGILMNEIRMVPLQPGNEGASDDANKPQVQGHAATAAYPVEAQMPVTATVVPVSHPHAPAHPVAAAPVATAPVKSGVATAEPLDSFLAQREQERMHRQQLERGWVAVTHQAAAPVQQQPAPYYNPAAPFVHAPAGPVYAAPPPQMQPVHTGRGLDFGSILAGNPGVAYATGGPMYQGGYQQAPAPQTSRFFAQVMNPGMQPMQMQPQGYYQQPQQQQGYYQQPQGYQRSL